MADYTNGAYFPTDWEDVVTIKPETRYLIFYIKEEIEVSGNVFILLD